MVDCAQSTIQLTASRNSNCLFFSWVIDSMFFSLWVWSVPMCLWELLRLSFFWWNKDQLWLWRRKSLFLFVVVLAECFFNVFIQILCLHHKIKWVMRNTAYSTKARPFVAINEIYRIQNLGTKTQALLHDEVSKWRAFIISYSYPSSTEHSFYTCISFCDVLLTSEERLVS